MGNGWGRNFSKCATEDGGIKSTIKNSCDTRKSRDKRVKAASLGLLIGAYPCGTVPLFDELFNSEGIAQVHGILIEYLATVTDKKQLDFVIYDDACHLVKYSRNEKVAERNETTKFFSERKFVIDKGSCQNSSAGIFWNGPPVLLLREKFVFKKIKSIPKIKILEMSEYFCPFEK